MDRRKVEAALDACLLSDDEMALLPELHVPSDFDRLAPAPDTDDEEEEEDSDDEGNDSEDDGSDEVEEEGAGDGDEEGGEDDDGEEKMEMFEVIRLFRKVRA
jgi:hypothetical protein